MKRNFLISILIALVVTGVANAGAIKTWSTEVLLSSDLNATFEHIHGALRGGSHTLITNADLSASAAIAHTKMATPGLLSKGWASLSAVCAAGTCAQAEASGIAFTITFVSDGLYNVAFAARTDAAYAAFATALTVDHYCTVHTQSTSAFRVECQLHDGVATNTAFNVMLMDAE